MKLSEQCAELGIAYRRLELARTVEGWLVAGRAHRRPESVAMAMLRSEGWTCAGCEGGPMLLLMKAACLPRLMELNSLGPRDT